MFIAKLQVGSTTVELNQVKSDDEDLLIYSIILEDGQELAINEDEYNNLKVIINMLDNVNNM